MIAIIILVIMLISFTSIVSYNLLSFNHNLNVSNESELLNKELVYIKQKLILNAKPIIGEEEYSLPFGVNDSELLIHKLPSDLGFSEKNIKGYYFQYCPYGYYDSTIKNDGVFQNDGSGYSVSLTNVSGVDYVTHSDAPPVTTNPNAPVIKGLILSKFNNDLISCDDVEYNEHNNKFYLNNAKVETITEDEIIYYYKISNLSSQTEHFEVDSANVGNAFNTISNDVSNKSYYVELTENVTLSSDYDFYRKPSKKTNIEINTNGYEIYGSNKIFFENINGYIHGSDGVNIPIAASTAFHLNSSDITIENVSFGGLELNKSNVDLVDSLIYTSGTQRAIYSYNSNLSIDGSVFVISNDSNTNLSLVDLNDSKLTISKGSKVDAETENGKSSFILGLKKSDAFISGEFNHVASSKDPYSSIFIGEGSLLHLDGGILTTLGEAGASDSKYDIDVRGTLSSGGENVDTSSINMKAASGKSGIVKVSNGGKLALDNIKIGETGARGVYTVYEASSGNARNGASMVSGDNDVYITSGSLGCWTGYSFENELDIVSQASSGTIKENNTSDWSCL